MDLQRHNGSKGMRECVDVWMSMKLLSYDDGEALGVYSLNRGKRGVGGCLNDVLVEGGS